MSTKPINPVQLSPFRFSIGEDEWEITDADPITAQKLRDGDRETMDHVANRLKEVALLAISQYCLDKNTSQFRPNQFETITFTPTTVSFGPPKPSADSQNAKSSFIASKIILRKKEKEETSSYASQYFEKMNELFDSQVATNLQRELAKEFRAEKDLEKMPQSAQDILTDLFTRLLSSSSDSPLHSRRKNARQDYPFVVDDSDAASKAAAIANALGDD